jgi:hypothetical protein
VPVQVVLCMVVDLGSTRVSVAREVLHLVQQLACLEQAGDQGAPDRVRRRLVRLQDGRLAAQAARQPPRPNLVAAAPGRRDEQRPVRQPPAGV